MDKFNSAVIIFRYLKMVYIQNIDNIQNLTNTVIKVERGLLGPRRKREWEVIFFNEYSFSIARQKAFWKLIAE